MADVIQQLAVITVTGWLEDHAEDHVAALSEEFNQQADILNLNVGKALTGAESPEQILALGSAKVKAGIAAREAISHAVGQLHNLHSLINRVLVNAGEPQLTASRLVDPATVDPENLDPLLDLVNAANWTGLVQAGYRIHANSPRPCPPADAQLADLQDWAHRRLS